MSLPPLPEPKTVGTYRYCTACSRGVCSPSEPNGYTADQLREAQRAVAEECVKLCELSAENMAADAAEDVRALDACAYPVDNLRTGPSKQHPVAHGAHRERW